MACSSNIGESSGMENVNIQQGRIEYLKLTQDGLLLPHDFRKTLDLQNLEQLSIRLKGLQVSVDAPYQPILI